MTTEDIIAKSARLASLLAAGHTVTYAPDPVWDGWFADLRDARGRRVECGSGPTQELALASLAARAERDSSGLAVVAPGDDDRIAELERKTEEIAGQIRQIREHLNDGDGGLAVLLKDGHAVSFTYEPADGYRAVIDVFIDDETVITHEGIAATPAQALAAARDGMGSDGGGR